MKSILNMVHKSRKNMQLNTVPNFHLLNYFKKMSKVRCCSGDNMQNEMDRLQKASISGEVSLSKIIIYILGRSKISWGWGWVVVCCLMLPMGCNQYYTGCKHPRKSSCIQTELYDFLESIFLP